MKQKDIVYLAIAVVIMLGSGYVAFTQLVPKKASDKVGVQVEVVGEIPASFHEEGMRQLTDGKTSHDFNVPVDFSSLNNTAPFGR